MYWSIQEKQTCWHDIILIKNEETYPKEALMLGPYTILPTIILVVFWFLLLLKEQPIL